MDIGIKLLPVMWLCLCIPQHIHCSCTVVMVQVHCVMHILNLFSVLVLQSLYVPLQIFQSLVSLHCFFTYYTILS